jgi:chromosome segregation ATPase
VQDLRIFALVRDLRSRQVSSDGQRLTVDGIISSIRQAVADDTLPPVPDALPSAGDHRAQVQTTMIAWQTERAALQHDIEAREKRLEELEQRLDSERAAHMADVERLTREIGQIREDLRERDVMLRLYESGRLKPPGDIKTTSG